MLVTELQVRFFKSFNYDYEAKFRNKRTRHDWENTPLGWYPFIRIPIEGDVTAIVGANESGKSQLLKALEIALGQEPILRSEFCRYSELYSVQKDQLRSPEFGLRLLLQDSDSAIRDVLGAFSAEEFTIYRPGTEPPFVVANGTRLPLDEDQLKLIQEAMPSTLSLNTDLAIPDEVSYAELIGESWSAIHDRSQRGALVDWLMSLKADPEPSDVGSTVLDTLSRASEAGSPAERKRKAEAALARQLLVDGAGIDPRSIKELRTAMRDGNEGEVSSLTGAINRAIRENLNIQRWWSQDRDFDLLVEARDHDLAFLIQDRTKARYSFDERSQGLRYFLSYFVQLNARNREAVKPDILLLDEPDAFLSSVGQADLLRVLQNYANPEDGSPRSQVIYVTHSPFLIDKNSPHRIRVLDKGSESEGTRVVRDAANNRYEPLRSSLGEYVAETAFIGGKNLFVEGKVDQILLVGLSGYLARRNGSTAGVLNLNEVTVVAADGADAVPYMVYLARGRDTVKPPCVALLDGDSPGQRAEQLLVKRAELRKRRILQDRFVVRLDTWAADDGVEADQGVVIREIEDLVPIDIGHRAALNYLARFRRLEEADAAAFTVQAIKTGLAASEGRMWDSIAAAYRSAFSDEHIEKAGWAREVVALLGREPRVSGADALCDRMARLLAKLSELLDDAAIQEDEDRADDRLKRTVRNFELNHTTGMRKHDAVQLLRQIDVALGASAFRDQLHPQLEKIAHDFELDDGSAPLVARFDDFRTAISAFGTVERLAYQDDAEVDPAAAVLPGAANAAAKGSKPKPTKRTPRKRSAAAKQTSQR